MSRIVRSHLGQPRLRRSVVLALTLLGGFSLFGVACSKSPSAKDAGGLVLRLSQRNEPADLDPATATLPDEFAVIRALSEGLLIPGVNGGAPLPGAAESFEISPDGLTYTFHLRRNARWSNGESVTAQHFLDSYRRLLSPQTAAPKASVFYPVKNARQFVSGDLTDFAEVDIHVVDAHTLVITLEQPTPGFPHYVASGPWLPIHSETVTKHGRRWTQPGNYVGNGPFVLTEWRSDQRIVVRKNPHWHGATGVKLDELQFLRFDSGDSEERAFRAGQVDVTMAVPESKVPGYADERPDALHRIPMIETRYLTFNTRREPLNDERVRRALSLAIDRVRLAQRVTRGGQIAATRFVPSQLRGAGNEALPNEHHHDPDTARRLFAEAGWTGASFPRLELSTWSNNPVLEAVQAMWRQELGIEVSITLRDAKVHLSALANSDYDIGFITAIPDVADIANLLGDLVSGAPENYPQWSDPAFDRAYADAATETNEPARSDAWQRVESRLLEAAPLAPLYFNSKVWLMSPEVRGWQEDGLWTRTYQGVSLEK